MKKFAVAEFQPGISDSICVDIVSANSKDEALAKYWELPDTLGVSEIKSYLYGEFEILTEICEVY